MGTSTPRLGLYKPENDGSDTVDVSTDLNANYDKLDSTMGFVPATSSTEVTGIFDGMAKHETDTGHAFFRKSGVWTQLLAAGSTFLSNLLLGTGTKLGIGIAIPTAIIDAWTTAGNVFMKFSHTGDTNPRVQVEDAGIKFGPGNAATDVRLYRNGVEQLQVEGDTTFEDDVNIQGTASTVNLNVTGNLDLDGTVLQDLNVTGSVIAGGIGQLKVARKLVDTPKANNSLGSDPELTLTVDANSIYEVKAYLFVSGDAAADVITQWSAPTGATWLRHCFGPAPSSSSYLDTTMHARAANIDFSIQYGLSSTSTYGCIQEQGLLITAGTAGSLTLRFAQFSTNATTTVMRALSSVVLRKIA